MPTFPTYPLPACLQVGDACLLAIVIDNLGNRYHQVSPGDAHAGGRHGFAGALTMPSCLVPCA